MFIYARRKKPERATSVNLLPTPAGFLSSLSKFALNGFLDNFLYVVKHLDKYPFRLGKHIVPFQNENCVHYLDHCEEMVLLSFEELPAESPIHHPVRTIHAFPCLYFVYDSSLLLECIITVTASERAALPWGLKVLSG